ncbi:MAG: UDP-N-acetylmuramate dehydrogenase [Flavobacteriaceae bacterium]
MEKQFSLQSKNSFGLEVLANLYLPIYNSKELPQILEQLSNKELLILGGGTNILFTQDFKGVVLQMCHTGIEKISETAQEVLVEVQAGEVWHDFVMWANGENLGGIENLALIPGSVGAAPIQNIGAYGLEQASSFVSCKVWDRHENQFQTILHDQCDFGYRDSVFKSTKKGRYIICSVTYRLQKQPHSYELSYGGLAGAFKNQTPSIQAIAQEVIRIRESKLPDPKTLGNAGSFFKNPVVALPTFKTIQKKYPEIPSYPVDSNHLKIPAAWLIDTLGWKGYRKGDAGVHTKQALVLLNHGNAKGIEIQELALKIQADVFQNFGIRLIPEVNIL